MEEAIAVTPHSYMVLHCGEWQGQAPNIYTVHTLHPQCSNSRHHSYVDVKITFYSTFTFSRHFYPQRLIVRCEVQRRTLVSHMEGGNLITTLSSQLYIQNTASKDCYIFKSAWSVLMLLNNNCKRTCLTYLLVSVNWFKNVQWMIESNIL